MKLHEFYGKLVESKVGREYQHLEDLVFVDGSAGALRAADILDGLASDSSDVAIKWDGNPTIYWGRELDSTFVLVGKNGWGKNMSTSAQDLSNFIKQSGKGEDWRGKFGNDMGIVFDAMEKATPIDFRGYVYGDLLFHPGKAQKVVKDVVTFTPNHVTYTVKIDGNNIGARMAQADVCVVVHTQHNEFGSKEGTPLSDVEGLNSPNVVVLGQTYVQHQPELHVDTTADIRDSVNKFGKAIDAFLAPVKGLSDMKNIIYTYVNQTSKAKNLANIESAFFAWLNTSKVSTNKQAKIKIMHDESPLALPAIFLLVKDIMTAKDDIIEQLDAAETEVTATTGEESGGEGFVAQNSKIKLVPRQRWQPNWTPN
jgi:hypothetical protein